MHTYLTGAQVHLLKKSFRQLNAQVYSDYFYARLFERHPEIRPMFPSDMDDLKMKLMSVLELVMFSFEEKQHGQFSLQEPLIVPLRHLGITHEEKGVLPAHYQIANGLMLESLAYTLGPIHSTEIDHAWQLALGHLTSTMLNKSIRLPERQTADSGINIRDTFNQLLKKIKEYAS